MLDRLVLGTAQFGMAYGISNKRGKVPKKEVFEILDYAGSKGIGTLDTAYSYGESEEIIGEFLSKPGANFDVISKMPDLDKGGVSAVKNYFLITLRNLKQAKIYGYLVHKFDNIIARKELWDELESLKRQGLVSKIGVSLYLTNELEYLLNSGIRFDIAQVPYNIFDQRFETYFPLLKEMGIEIHARSVFLQGLFFLEGDRFDREFEPAKRAMDKLRDISSRHGIPIPALCLCFAFLNPYIRKVIVGVDSLRQLKENITSLERADEVRRIYDLFKSLKLHNDKVILPCNWQ